MKILLTGATGFVGGHVGRELAKQGHDVVVVSRDPKRAKIELSFASHAVTWDGLHDAVEIQGIVHLAGDSVANGRWTKQKKERIVASRIDTTRKIIDFIHTAKVKPEVFVSASAVGFYGDCGEELLMEEASPGSDFLAGVCLAWENEALRAEELGVRTVVLRLGMVLGKDGGAFAKILPIFKWGLGGRLGSGDQWMSWIHIRDLSRMFCFAIERESVRGIYNAVAPRAARNWEFTQALAAALKRPAFFPVPGFALKIMLGEMSTMLLGSQRADPAKIVNHGFSFDFIELEHAFQDLV